MNVDKAYILGLVIGGGVFGSNDNAFHIKLPYKQWGSIEKNPARAGKIAQDIIKVVAPMLKGLYQLDASYEATEREWNIRCYGDLSKLKNDLVTYGISPRGELRKNASIEGIIPDLVDDNMRRRFIAGLADTIGSTTKSHRRFSDDVQIMSFEISGFRYDFVCQLCKLLYSVKCYPDQILWNHPNFHSTMDRYYGSWKKGFKLRVQLDQYARFGAFAFKTKAESAIENRRLQSQTNTALPCKERVISVKKTCVHEDENSTLLPENIRGGHYLHNKHVCCVWGCEYAPYDQVEQLIADAGHLINPFPILHKDLTAEINKLIQSVPVYANRTFNKVMVSVSSLYSLSKDNPRALLYGTNEYNGYPINIIIQALTFIIAANTGRLNGNRPRGSQDEILDEYIKNNGNLAIEAWIPDKPTVLIIRCNDHSAMIGAENPRLYSQLVTRDADNRFKIRIRDITEEDLDGIS